MKKKLIIFGIANIITIPISMYISSYINLIISKSDIRLIKIESSFNEIFSNNESIKICLLIQALFMVLFFIAIFTRKNSIYDSKQIKVTDSIWIPQKAGQGQYGSSRFLTNKEFNKKYPKFIIDKKTNAVKKVVGGIVVGYKDNKKCEEISVIADNKHTLCIGNTGSGKTRRVLIESLCTLGLTGESIILSDPKGELFELTSPFFKKLGYEVNVIDLKYKFKSNKFNFLQAIIDAINEENYGKAEEYTWDFVENLVEKRGNNVDPLWENGEKSIVAGSIFTVIYENREYPEYQNLTNVYLFISNMCKTDDSGYMPLVEYVDKLEDDNPAKNIFAISTIASEKTRSGFFTSALATMKLFTGKEIYSMTCKSDFKLDDIGKKKCIRYIMLPDDKLAYYPLATLYISQQYQTLVTLADSQGGKLKVRTNFMLEEFGNFATISNFENMLTVSRSRNIRFSMYIQSFSQLESKYSKTGAENIMDNTQVWIYLKTSSNNTSDIISKKVGNYTVAVSGKSNSYGKNEKSSSESISLASRNLLTPDEVMRFEVPYILVMQSGDFPIVTKLPDLSKWIFNKMLGLGSEDENTRIRQEVENNREIKSEEDMKIWRVWDDYKY